MRLCALNRYTSIACHQNCECITRSHLACLSLVFPFLCWNQNLDTLRPQVMVAYVARGPFYPATLPLFNLSKACAQNVAGLFNYSLNLTYKLILMHPWVRCSFAGLQLLYNIPQANMFWPFDSISTKMLPLPLGKKVWVPSCVARTLLYHATYGHIHTGPFYRATLQLFNLRKACTQNVAELFSYSLHLTYKLIFMHSCYYNYSASLKPTFFDLLLQ